MTEIEILGKALDFFTRSVKPEAQNIDQHPEALRLALKGLCQAELMALKRPNEFGGPALSEPMFRSFQEMSARYSGSLSFLMTQHQSAVGLLAKSENEDLKSDYLPKMHNGERLLGIGFSQLRRQGAPSVTAEATSAGYVLNGLVPWVTGWTFFPEFIVGAKLPDERCLFAIAPLATGHGVTVSEPMRLAAMESALTVTVEFHNFEFDASRVLFIQPSDWALQNDQINIVLQGHFALGCAQAGIDIVIEAAERRHLPFLERAADRLQKEIDLCRDEMSRANLGPSEIATDEKLAIRAWAIELAVRCAHAGIAASSGAANSLQHPAQRVYREALVYTVSAQTLPIMEATIDRLTR